MPPHRRILILAFCTGITAGLASSLSIEWMRYLMVTLIGIVGALFWQINEVREEAENHVIRAVSHHLNNSLTVTMNRRYLAPNVREQIVDEELLRCAWVIRTILPSLKVGLPDLLKIRRQAHPNQWAEPDEKWWQQQPPTVH
ncbi:MAG TPA: hypothetical protein VHV29_07240 [Terriglobales bacterium]|jgi:hypothetical protein|nr:hypothetical protein [Terriglobales bacterium]